MSNKEDTITTIKKPVGQVRVYSAGGCGINMGTYFEEARGVVEVGTGVVHPVYVDTARSNLKSHIPEDQVYLIPDVDGSGGERKEHFKKIDAHTPDILKKFPPLDLNIVISSGSGGSGSVIAPCIVSELIKQGKTFIVVTIGDSSSIKFATNTQNTLLSYESLAKMHGKAIQLAYFENTHDKTRQEVDNEVLQTITLLSTLFSRQHKELDTKDLENFLNPNIVTSYPPQLSTIFAFHASVPKDLQSKVMTVATLAAEPEQARLPFTPEMQYVGYTDEAISANIVRFLPIHYVTVDNQIAPIVRRMAELLETSSAERRTREKTRSLLADDIDTTSNGLVL